MAEHEITRFPPILQLAGLGLLGGYVLVSIVARLSPRFGWLWRDKQEVRTFSHLLEYTIVPALMFVTAAAAAAYNWNPAAPLDGGWPASKLILGPGAALLGGVLAVAATVLGKGADTADPSALRSWLPLVLLLSGLVLMGIGVFTLGRT